jgi:hypothetical protein
MKLIKVVLFLLPFLCYSQTDTSKTKDLKVYLKTDINYASSTSDSRKEAQSATGTLGIKFEVENIYGSSTFTIHSQNEQISTSDSLEKKLFGSSLLLPQNSSSNISNFELQLGMRSFCKKGSQKSKYIRAIGGQFTYRINNTIWEKSSISIPITISSVSLDLTYRLLDVGMSDSDERIKLMMSFGYINRRLGGDYGLNQNFELRKEFLGTDRLGFDGLKVSTRLEISKFYGQIDITNFGKKHNISGFSGDQAIITLGIRADLQLPTKVK